MWSPGNAADFCALPHLSGQVALVAAKRAGAADHPMIVDPARAGLFVGRCGSSAARVVAQPEKPAHAHPRAVTEAGILICYAVSA
jgi:hypothetical protein